MQSYSTQMAAFTALRRERVAYVDTVGSFAWEGFQAMAGALPRHAECADAAEAQRFLDLYRVFSLHDLLQLLHALSKTLDQVWAPRAHGDGICPYSQTLSHLRSLCGLADREGPCCLIIHA